MADHPRDIPVRALAAGSPGEIPVSRIVHEFGPEAERGGVDPDHHLWRNGRLWWIAFTVHRGHLQERVRFSLGTDDVELARKRRDEVFAKYDAAADCKISIRLRPRQRRVRNPRLRRRAPMAGDFPNAEPAKVVVALSERSTGKLFVGERWEQHADLRRRRDLGERTDGWLTPGFIDLATGEFLTRSQAFRRFPEEAGRTRGHGLADSSDFECIRAAKLERVGRGR